MAYLDSQLEFSDAQAITSTALSTNVYDILAVRKGGSAVSGDTALNTRPDLGAGNQDIWVSVTVNTTFTTGTSANLTVTFETADDAAMSTNATVLTSSASAIAVGSLTAGTQILAFVIPSALYRRYIALRYTVGVGTFTAGAVDAYMTPVPQINRIYKSAITVQ